MIELKCNHCKATGKINGGTCNFCRGTKTIHQFIQFGEKQETPRDDN